ncbi:MAG: FkbM family methyltransferase [Saprospiraceae bacterium]|nr:FkbM family methyltransferase [Saprospiraceae bacterium]
MNKGAIRLYQKCKQKNYRPKKICEVGVFLPEESNVLGFIKDDIPTTLIEADPIYAQNIRTYFEDRKNVEVVEAAVFDYRGTVELCRRASSTFISQLSSSPALVNDRYEVKGEDIFTVKSIVFDDVDKGAFDLVSIDIEGAEWYVIKNMVSRPDILSIETHGKYYINPQMELISDWLNKNKYQLWYKDDSDSVYIKMGLFPITSLEKLSITGKNLQLKLHQVKKFFKNIWS